MQLTPGPGGRGYIASFKEANWHLKLLGKDSHPASNTKIIKRLQQYRQGLLTRRHPPTIYRADCQLGLVSDELWQTVVLPVGENEVYGARLDRWSFRLGPVTMDSETDDETTYVVGWMRIKLSGQGHRGTRSTREIVARAEAQPAIQAMMRVCREQWPVLPEPVSEEIIAARRSLGEYWPYERHDQPRNWHWGYSES